MLTKKKKKNKEVNKKNIYLLKFDPYKNIYI